MVRDQILFDIPQEWTDNLKVGHCWCGKPRSEFDREQKIYCSEDHAIEYSKRIKYWSIFKDEFLDKVERVCQKCGMTEKQFDRQEEQREIQYYKILVVENKKAIEAERARLLVEWDRRYKAILDDVFVLGQMSYHTKEEFGSTYERFWKQHFKIEVDHKKAVALGGDMWDESNLQALCSDCHKVKTKIDMKLIKEYKLNQK